MSIIIIGGGHNGLTTAFYLAKAGFRPLVLERRDIVGGAAVTEEIGDGFRCPTLAHTIGPLRPAVARDMQLAARGVHVIAPDPHVVALSSDGRALALSSDPERTSQAVAAFSSKDATRYAEFCQVLARLGGFLAELIDITPPSLSGPAIGELWELLKTGRRFRALGREDSFRLLRWGPMAVADLVSEFFESDLLQATVAARGLFGSFAGPWSAGTGAVLLLNAAHDPTPAGSGVTIKGGPGALTHAMAEAAKQAGAEIRLNADVVRVATTDGRVSGVVLGDGTELRATTVISNADPRRTFLGLLDPMDLGPGFAGKIRNYRCPGVVAKVNLGLAALPDVRGVGGLADLRGRLHIGPGIDYLEKAFDAAKYGEVSAEPYLDITIPSLHDPTLARSGHVMSVHVQYAPYRLKTGDWSTARAALERTVIDTLERHAPGIEGLIRVTQVLTPADLETVYGLTGGHGLHGEPALDQLFTMRPVLGWAQYRTPIEGLYLCGAGTHPGGGVTAAPGRNAAREVLKDLKGRKS